MLKIRISILTLLAVVCYNGSLNAQWTQKGADVYGQASQDLFGSSIAMSADGFIMAVGSPDHSTLNGEVGMVRILEWSGTDWVQRGQDIVGDVEWNKFGHAVDLSDDGTILAVGAPGIENLSSTEDPTIGRVLIFNWDGSSWNPMGASLSYNNIYDVFGESVALSADGYRLAVGAPWTTNGESRVFEWDGNNWIQMGSDILGENGGTFAGTSVALSPDGLIMTFGAISNDGNLGSGAVRTYTWDGNDWFQNVDMIPGDTTADEFGRSISMAYGTTDTLIIIGAYRNDDNGNNAGKVVVYKRNGNSWDQYGSALLGEAANDWFGYSVAISGDGTRIVVGGNKHNANGLGSGHAKMYEWSGSDWQQIGSAIGGDAPSDECGAAVVMNYTGNIVAIGAPLNDGNWTNAGQVRVYEDGIQGLNSLNGLNITMYPNPVQEVLHVDGLEEEKIDYSIIDLAGRVVQKGSLSQTNSLDMSGLNSGVYTLQLKSELRIVSEVLVKK